MKPKISIVTPSYNQGQFLEETILSVLDQDYPNLEYIIIDGGSTDNSVKIIKKYEDRLAYWVSESDRGQADAVNRGFRMASDDTDIICFLNSDDLYTKGTLKRVAEEFVNNEDVGIIYGDHILIDSNGRWLETRKSFKFDGNILFWFGCFIQQPASFFRRGIFKNYEFFDTNLKFFLDWDFYLQAYRRGVKFMYIPDTLCLFRLHNISKTVTIRSQVGNEREMVRRRYAVTNFQKRILKTKIYFWGIKNYFRTLFYLKLAMNGQIFFTPLPIRRYLARRSS